MLDLTKSTGDGVGYMTKLGIRRDGTSDNHLLI